MENNDTLKRSECVIFAQEIEELRSSLKCECSNIAQRHTVNYLCRLLLRLHQANVKESEANAQVLLELSKRVEALEKEKEYWQGIMDDVPSEPMSEEEKQRIIDRVVRKTNGK